MRNDRFLAAKMILAVGLLLSLANFANAQLWHEFTHPDDPHVNMSNPDVRITTSELFDDPNAVVQRPVLVVLMEYTDVTHETVHDAAFFSDLLFGENRADGRPSTAETYHENSNGRLSLVPATAGDQHGSQDGIVGWVTTPHTFDYWNADRRAKRAEGIRQADPFFDYSLYDTNSDGTNTSDELVIVVVNAEDNCCDQHVGHTDFPDCSDCAGGNVRQTNPSQVEVEGGSLEVYQHVAGLVEQAHGGVFAHEIAHQLLGLTDLYKGDGCNLVDDGYVCNGDWRPPPPVLYSLMDKNPASIIAHLDPWAKIHLGFVKPLVVTHDGTHSLYDAETERNFSTQNTQPEAIIIHDPLRPDPYKEYFILENRNLNYPALDRGLAVWLINENETSLKKVIRLIRRGGHWAGDLDALWDGSNDTDGYDLTATSTPRNTSWTNGSVSYIEIYDISEAGPVMTFKIRMPPIFVDKSNLGLIENGSQDFPYNTLSEGISAVPQTPRTIKIAGGSYPEQLMISTPLTLMGWRNGNAVIGK